MVEEVIVPVELGQLNSDLYSSVIWSRVGLVNFKQYKKKVFEEFEKKELEFYTKYPKVTPFANEQIEMEYTKQVQFVGEEEEFNLDSFILFDQEEEEQVEDSLEEVTHVPESVLEHYESISHEDLDLEDEVIIIRRDIYSSGKSVCRINGTIVNLSTLKKVAAHLLDIHEQHDNQVLLVEKNHLNLVDSFNREKIQPVYIKYKEKYKEYQIINEKIDT